MSDSKTLGRAKVARMIATLDLVATAMILADEMQTPLNGDDLDHCMAIMHSMREELSKTYNLNITVLDSLKGDFSKHLTPAEEAELICEEL